MEREELEFKKMIIEPRSVCYAPHPVIYIVQPFP